MAKKNKYGIENRSRKYNRDRNFDRFMHNWNKRDLSRIKREETKTNEQHENIQDKKESEVKTVSRPFAQKNAFISNKVYQSNLERTKSIVKAKGYGKLIDKPSVRVMFLGGLDEIGKNMTLFECMGDMFILDCGMTFPDREMLGVDLVLPDFTYVERNKDKIRGIVITHGHEDHIGALPYLFKSGIDVPIYATPLAQQLIKSKFKEHGTQPTSLFSMPAGKRINLGCMNVELIHVNHSIPDAVGVAIHTPAGLIVHTGDFKIDFTPIAGNMINLQRFAELGRKGVLALMADSTNAEKPGYTMTEQKVIETIDSLFYQAQYKRIIIASFASNVNRIAQIIKIAEKYDRRVAFSGRSMLSYFEIAKKLGYIQAKDGTVIDIASANQYPDHEIVLLTTGSQGEPMAALSRMAYGEHHKISVGSNDFIIISARPIPGNEKSVGDVIDLLLKRGCEVIYESMYEVHVSGHACREELKLLHTLVKPKYFIPVHGERKQLVKHADIAKKLGMSDSDIFIGENGDVAELNEVYMKKLPCIPSGQVFVDGKGIGDVGSVVLRDRKRLGEDGIIIVVMVFDKKKGEVKSGPDIISRGFVYVKESEPLIESARNRVVCVLDDCKVEGICEWGIIKSKIKDSLAKFFYEKTKRSPMILPIIMDI